MLDLSMNSLSGIIPAELAELSSLKQLGLSDNQMSGTIPDLSTLTELLQLFLDSQPAKWEFPSGLNGLVSVGVIEMGNNRLSCDIPDLSSLTQLIALEFQNNHQLGGTLSENLVDRWEESGSLT